MTAKKKKKVKLKEINNPNKKFDLDEVVFDFSHEKMNQLRVAECFRLCHKKGYIKQTTSERKSISKWKHKIKRGECVDNGSFLKDNDGNFHSARYLALKSCMIAFTFLVTNDFLHKKINSTIRCKSRICPLCQVADARNFAFKLATIVNYITKKLGYKLLFGTLTVPNCTGKKLPKTIDLLFKSYKNLVERDQFEKIAKGFYGKMEITWNSKSKNWHPHIHFLMIVPNDYFELDDKALAQYERDLAELRANRRVFKERRIKRKEFLSKNVGKISIRTWEKNWTDIVQKQSMKIFGKKQKTTEFGNLLVNIKEVDNSDDGAIFEMAKYCAKPFNDDETSDAITDEVLRRFADLYNAIYGRNMTNFRGLFGEVAAMYKNGELEEWKPEGDTYDYTRQFVAKWLRNEKIYSIREIDIDDEFSIDELIFESSDPVVSHLREERYGIKVDYDDDTPEFNAEYFERIAREEEERKELNKNRDDLERYMIVKVKNKEEKTVYKLKDNILHDSYFEWKGSDFETEDYEEAVKMLEEFNYEFIL